MILVTGGTGLVGSHLLYDLVCKNKQVKAIYRRPHTLERVKHVFSYYSENHDILFNKIEWIEADLNNIPALQLAFENVNYVYHCAAFVSFEPNKYHQLRKVNIEGTANIVNLCISNKIKKLCYVSSIAAIGHETNPDQLITEESLKLMRIPADLEWKGTPYGMGWYVVNDPVYGRIVRHGGSQSGTSTYLSIFLDQRFVVAVLANNTDGNEYNLHRELYEMTLDPNKRMQPLRKIISLRIGGEKPQHD